MKTIISRTIFIMSVLTIFLSCDRKIESITDNECGKILIENISTNESVILSGGFVIIPLLNGIATSEILQVHNGDTLNIKFEPKDKYRQYSFKTKYEFPNGEIVENKYVYQYVVKEIEQGDYPLNFSATYKDKEDDNFYSLSTGGDVIMRVVE